MHVVRVIHIRLLILIYYSPIIHAVRSHCNVEANGPASVFHSLFLSHYVYVHAVTRWAKLIFTAVDRRYNNCSKIRLDSCIRAKHQVSLKVQVWRHRERQRERRAVTPIPPDRYHKIRDLTSAREEQRNYTKEELCGKCKNCAAQWLYVVLDSSDDR